MLVWSLLQRPLAGLVLGRRLLSDATPSLLSSPEEMLRSISSGVAPATGQKYADIGAELFGHVAPLGSGQEHQRRSGRKLLKKKLKGDVVVDYYIPTPEQNPYNPLKLTAQQERWRAKLSVMRMQGRGPPKKGSGKRAK